MARVHSPIVPVLITSHFLALFVFPLPRGEDSFGRLPDPIRAPLAATVPPIASAVGRVSDPYVRFFSLQQHWSFFAPNPLADTPVLIGTVFGRTEGSGTEPATRPDAPEGALADEWGNRVVFLPSPLDPERSRVLRDRRLYLLLKGAEAEAHPVFHATIARWVCALAIGSAPWDPEGVRLRVNWYPVDMPWGMPEAGYAVPLTEDLGGYRCVAR